MHILKPCDIIHIICTYSERWNGISDSIGVYSLVVDCFTPSCIIYEPLQIRHQQEAEDKLQFFTTEHTEDYHCKEEMFSSADTLPDTRGQLFSERKSKDVKTVPGKGRRLGGLHSPRLSLKTEGLHGDRQDSPTNFWGRYTDLHLFT